MRHKDNATQTHGHNDSYGSVYCRAREKKRTGGANQSLITNSVQSLVIGTGGSEEESHVIGTGGREEREKNI
jgi:hypothetical protein